MMFPTQLPEHLSAGLQGLSDALRAACGENLQSLAIYGGVARGRWRADRSDINLLLLRSAAPEALAALSPILRRAGRELGARAMVLGADEVSAAARDFPVKFLDIRDHHILLHGEDFAQRIAPPAARVREAAAQSLRNLMMRLRAKLIADFDQPGALQAALAGMARPLAIELIPLLQDAGATLGGEDRTAAVYARAAAVFGLDAGVLGRLAALRDTPEATVADAAGLVAGVVGVLSTLLAAIAEEEGSAAR